MAEADALRDFDKKITTGSGLFLKFEAGKPVTLRVLTTDPIVSSVEYTDPQSGDITLTTKFSFIVYNFTDEKAQILSASPTIARKIGELHVDPDFGANIRKIDIKISPTGEKLQRRYDVQVLPKAHELTQEQIKEAQAIPLTDKVDGQRMSIYNPADYVADEDTDPEEPDDEANTAPVEDLGGQPINLDDIPFG